jgi:hypothetical protein
MNLVELVQVTSSEEEAEKFLRAKGILKTFNRCPFCGHQKIGKVRRSFFKCYVPKIKLKGMVLGDERKARVYAVEELAEVSPSKGKAYILMMLKFIRNAILLPFALRYVGELKGNGVNLYFQAKI